MRFVLEATLSTPNSPPKRITFRRSSPIPHPAVRYVVASVTVALTTPIFWVTRRFLTFGTPTNINVRLALGRNQVRISVGQTEFNHGCKNFPKT